MSEVDCATKFCKSRGNRRDFPDAKEEEEIDFVDESRRSDVRPKQIEQELSNDKQMTWEQDCVSGKAYYLSKDYPW